jgi:UDP-glucose 6-dehydrogenase
LYLKTCLLNKGDTIFVGAKQASMYKMARNSALAMRVALANEFKEICDKLDIDYDILTGMLSRDKVIGGTHWQVPGPDGKLGFGGKCLPKDLTHMSTLCYNEYNIMDDAIKANMIRKIREIGTFLDAAHAHFQ